MLTLMIVKVIFLESSYAEDDPKWIRVQRLREEGIKELAVAGPINFLPWIRFIMPKLKRTLNWIIEVTI